MHNICHFWSGIMPSRMDEAVVFRHTVSGDCNIRLKLRPRLRARMPAGIGLHSPNKRRATE
jgi:hypothetical protein